MAAWGFCPEENGECISENIDAAPHPHQLRWSLMAPAWDHSSEKEQKHYLTVTAVNQQT